MVLLYNSMKIKLHRTAELGYCIPKGRMPDALSHRFHSFCEQCKARPDLMMLRGVKNLCDCKHANVVTPLPLATLCLHRVIIMQNNDIQFKCYGCKHANVLTPLLPPASKGQKPRQ